MSACPMQWNNQTRLINDKCETRLSEVQARGSGLYQTGNPAVRGCITPKTYAALMCQPAHQQRQIRNTCEIDTDSKLRHATLTDQRYIDQLFARPYAGSFMGAGRPNADMDTESALIHGLTTRAATNRACDVLSGVSIDRFECLPEFGNPQRVQHIVEPWVRGGEHTRDLVRRVNYDARCRNKKNNQACIH